MEYATPNIFFARFFNPYNTEGQQETGFFENLDFSDYSEELDILTDIVAKNINLYLYNEYSQRYVVSTWARYMHWDKTNKRYNIDDQFYDDFSAALCGNLLAAENFYKLTLINFGSITENIQKYKNIGARSKTRTKGNDTISAGARQDSISTTLGQQQNSESETIGAQSTTNTTVYGLQHNTSDTENKRSAFNSTVYEPDTKSTTTNDANSHTDETTIAAGAQSNSRSVTNGSRSDSTTNSIGAQTTTKTFGDDVTADAATQDNEITTITKSIDPADLLKIKEELATLNIYQLIGDAIAATMLRKDFGYIRG